MLSCTWTGSRALSGSKRRALLLAVGSDIEAFLELLFVHITLIAVISITYFDSRGLHFLGT